MRRIALCSCHCCARRECPGQGRARQIRPKPGSELACFHACAQPIFSCMRTTHVFTHAHSLCCVFTHAHSPCCVHTCTCQWQVFRAFHTRHACHACASLPPDRLRHPGGSGPGFACPVLVRFFRQFHSVPETRPGSGLETGPESRSSRTAGRARAGPDSARVHVHMRLCGNRALRIRAHGLCLRGRASSICTRRTRALPVRRSPRPASPLLMHGPKRLYKLQKCLFESLNSSSSRAAGRTRPAPTPASSSFQVGGECLLAFSFPAKKRRRISPSLFASSDFASSSFQVGRPRKPRKPPENGRKPETVGNPKNPGPSQVGGSGRLTEKSRK